eukprot:7029025-Alexandrium_andersonii.AAC.1
MAPPNRDKQWRLHRCNALVGRLDMHSSTFCTIVDAPVRAMETRVGNTASWLRSRTLHSGAAFRILVALRRALLWLLRSRCV